MKKKEPTGNEKPGAQEEGLTRRKAIKRIAGLFAVAAVSAKVFNEAPPEFRLAAYFSNPVSDGAVYASASGAYSSIKFYTSYSSHYTSVPPPYSSSSRK